MPDKVRTLKSGTAGRAATAAAVAVALALGGGCTNIEDDSTRTKTEGTLVGASIGAGVGALIGALVNGKNGALTGAAIGAGIGSLSGFIVGKNIADRKAEFASREDWLDACIEHAHEVNEQTRSANDGLKREVAALDKESKTLAAQYRKKRVSAAALKSERDSILALQNDTRQNIEALESELLSQKKVAQDARDNGDEREAKIMDNEIRQLTAQIKEMKAYNQRLADLSVRLAV
ncbi:MAG: hypothetical protein IJ228_09910 [Succinivibrio sp.]|nr:hypothetical protein [Succinivibrio sp.]